LRAIRCCFYGRGSLSKRSAGMTQQTRGPRVHERWAHLRFSVIGQLLAAPPAKGELKAAIEGLAGRTWQHPTTGEPVRFGFSTIEHWYYRACKERTDPVGVLRRKVRANAGRQHAIRDAVRLSPRRRLIPAPATITMRPASTPRLPSSRPGLSTAGGNGNWEVHAVGGDRGRRRATGPIAIHHIL